LEPDQQERPRHAVADLLTATADSNNIEQQVMATTAITGTIYFETQTVFVPNPNLQSVGFGNSSLSFADGDYVGGTTTGCGYYGNGQIFFNNSPITTIASFTSGDVQGWAFNIPLGLFWVRNNTGGWLNDTLANQNPATNTGGISIPVSGTIFPTGAGFGGGGGSTSIFQLNASRQHFVNTPPSGYTAYDPNDPLGATINNTGSSSGTAGNNSSVGLPITTTAAKSFLLYEAQDWEGTGALIPPQNMAERFDSLVYSADQFIPTAGITGNRVQISGNVISDLWSVRIIELLSA
jgi:hypothetical protein